MKKILTLIVLSFLLVACGNEGDKGKQKDDVEKKDNKTETLKLSEAQKYKPEGTYKDKKIVRKDIEVEIEKMGLFKVEDKEGKQGTVVLFEYKVKNKKDENISATSAWIESTRVNQIVDGKPKELDIATIEDKKYLEKLLESSNTKIKKNGTAASMIGYELVDENSPIEIEFNNDKYEVVGKEKIELKDIATEKLK